MNKDLQQVLYFELIDKGKQLAAQYCSGGYPDKEDCSWYHGNWMLLRYLGLVSNPFWHEDFYEMALASTNAIEKRVLVLGTADFSMPLLCSECGIDSLDICDICSTPLKICDMVASKYSKSWNTFVQNVFDKADSRYDIIVNDAFLSRFTSKTDVLNAIHSRLQENGYYITTVKQGKQNRGGEITASKREAFILKAETRFAATPHSFGAYDIKSIANAYCDKMASFPVTSQKELFSIFRDSSFEVVHLSSVCVEGEFEESCYYRVIAKKV